MKPSDWPKVEKLYHAALERAPEARDSFVREACHGDEGLRREVLSLLAQEKDAARLMEEPAVGAATQELAVARGTRLGPYEVVDLLGAGGMGEVYRARDTRLGRDVAIKVLPAHVARDPEALTRLRREARAVAALSHPHIEALHDIGEHEGTHYLVMELLEGETLAARLRRGALPEKEALRIGAEIAEALGAAHAHGIVHRDVKPANVMLTRSGVKLLDFGLARLPPTPGVSGGTATAGLGGGVVAGTLPYMAPEQLEGREVDGRADIWALGCVLFEMLTGRPAFEGDSRAALIAAVEKDEAPSMAAHQPRISAAVDRLACQCLKKDPQERWQSARDLAMCLRACPEAEGTAERRAGAPRALRRALPIATAAALALVAGVAADRLWLRSPAAAPARPVVRSVIDLSPESALIQSRYAGVRLSSSSRTELALSPDGTRLVWSGGPDGSPEKAALHLSALGRGDVRRIAGTEGASQPFFSPDGRWVAFLLNGNLHKVPAEGGLVVDLAQTAGDGRVVMGGTWAPDGRIFLGSHLSGLFWVPAEGGRPQELTTVDATRETGHRLPFVLPGGRALLFTTRPHPWGTRARVEALVLATGKRRVLVEDCADARHLPSGHLVCVRQGVLVAAPFDAERLELTGPIVPAVDGVLQALNLGSADLDSGAGQLAVSASGLLAYASGGIFEDRPAELVLVDATGRAERLPRFDKPLVGIQNRFSPDGRRLAFTERARSGLLWLFDVERGTHVRLSRDGVAGSPVWSPDGSRLAVAWSQAGALGLWVVPTNGGGDWTRLNADGVPSSWSPDGRTLAFVSSGDVSLYRFEDQQVVPFLTSPASEGSPEFSPDGLWLAYVSDESGRHEIYVASFPARRRTLAVSRDGGISPAWSRDGRRLLYLSLDHQSVIEVPVHGDPTLVLGQPRRLFATPRFVGPISVGRFELHPDGHRFLFTRFLQEDPPPEITRLNLVQNWFTELERLAPTAR